MPPAAKAISAFKHPSYARYAPTWALLRDVRDGDGGFLDGTALVAHPREWLDYDQANPSSPTKKLKARRQLACGDAFAATIVAAMRAALFRQPPSRRVGSPPALPPQPPPPPKPGEEPIIPTSGDEPPQPEPVAVPQPTPQAPEPLAQWWDNVDGLGTHIDDFIALAWNLAATFGHVFLYLDKPAVDAQTAADEPLPILRIYTPLDAWDWLTDELGRLIAVKFAEAVPRTSMDVTPIAPQPRMRVIDATQWTLYDEKGARVDGGPHGMGVLPVVVLYGERRPLDPVLGRSILGDPKQYQDLYNLTSEVRELLRNQTFGILNVPLGTGPDAMTVEQASRLLGSATGTENVLFSGLAAGFISPDASNVEVYHAEILRRLRGIYRQCGLPWEADSRDAEAEGSIKLKREELNTRLAGFADECERTEYTLIELVYRMTKGQAWQQAMETDAPSVSYPQTFDTTPFDALIEQAQAAQSLQLPSLFLREMRKRLVRKFEGFADAPANLLQAIDQQIDAAPPPLTPEEQLERRVALMTKAGLPTTAKPFAP